MSDSLLAGLAPGDIVAQSEYSVTRDSLVRYAGASGDFNPIHYRDDVAAGVGLPGVLAHGMLTMGVAVQPVIDWLGDRGVLLEYETRFTRPVVVDPSDGASIAVAAKVTTVDAGSGEVRLELTVTSGGKTVLGKARALVRFR